MYGRSSHFILQSFLACIHRTSLCVQTEAVGSQSYNQLVEVIVSADSPAHAATAAAAGATASVPSDTEIINPEEDAGEGGVPVEPAAAALRSSVPPAVASKVGLASRRSHSRSVRFCDCICLQCVVKARVIREFLDETASQLTNTGLSKLRDAVLRSGVLLHVCVHLTRMLTGMLL